VKHHSWLTLVESHQQIILKYERKKEIQLGTTKERQASLRNREIDKQSDRHSCCIVRNIDKHDRNTDMQTG
jgi:hypothetical protein